MAAPYILARTLKDAHTFAREDLGLDRGHYRIATTPGTLKSVRGVDLYLVPGWEQRYDRFAMKSAIRYTRMNVVDVEQMRAEAPEPEVVDTPVSDEEAADFLAPLDAIPVEVPDVLIVDSETGDHVEAPAEYVAEVSAVPDNLNPPGEQLSLVPTEITPVPEPETKPKARRRRRCKDCGSLHFKEDPCPDESAG